MADPTSDDHALIRRVADGDREAFRALFEAYQQPVFRYLVRLMRDEAVARELTKLHEEIVRGGLAELAERFAQGEVKGEITLVVEGMERPRRAEPEDPGREDIPIL